MTSKVNTSRANWEWPQIPYPKPHLKRGKLKCGKQVCIAWPLGQRKNKRSGPEKRSLIQWFSTFLWPTHLGNGDPGCLVGIRALLWGWGWRFFVWKGQRIERKVVDSVKYKSSLWLLKAPPPRGVIWYPHKPHTPYITERCSPILQMWKARYQEEKWLGE